eukprot:1032958_1
MNRMANNRETTRRSPPSVKRVDCSHLYRPNHYQNLSKLQMNRSKCNIKWQEPDQMSKDPTLQVSSTHLQVFNIWILWQTKHRFERHMATYLFRKRPRLKRKRLANEWMNGKRWFETCGYQMKRQNQTLSCGNDDKIMGGLDFCNIFELR